MAKDKKFTNNNLLTATQAQSLLSLWASPAILYSFFTLKDSFFSLKVN